MVSLESLLREGRLRRIPELEKARYLGFFAASSADNLAHSAAVRATFPRWSIISGYYAMHDRTKLLLALKVGVAVEFEVHATAIKALEALRYTALAQLLERGRQEFIALANDLAQAKRERTRAQYYTGTPYSAERFRAAAAEFRASVVEPYLRKLQPLLEGHAPPLV